MSFTKFLRTSIGRTTPDDCSLCLSENFEKFFRIPLFWITLFHAQVAEFQPPDTVRNYFTSAFQAFYIMKLRDASLQVYEKNSFTHLLSCILPSFSQNASRLLFRRGFESVRAQFLSAESSIACNLPVQSQFI